jgi:hypothetical protein
VSVALATVPGQRRADAGVNVDYLVCGLAASLRDWQPRQFAQFIGWCGGSRDGKPGEPVDLLADHQRWLFTPRGRVDAAVGRCLRFAAVAASGDFPGGLLVLAGLSPERAAQVLASMRAGQWGAMSVGGVEHGLPGGPADLWPVEVSLVRAGDQADAGALVIGTGRDALAAWELLTGLPAGAGG